MDREFQVVDVQVSCRLEIGETAPDFEGPLVNNEFWETTALSDLTATGPVLLVFYPMDGDFPATYIWNELRDRAWEEHYDLTIIGLSISSPYEHKTFIRERGMQYELFSDPQNEVAEKYDIVHDLDGMTGISEPLPAVFLLDDDRTISYRWIADEWPDFPDYDEIETFLEPK